MMAAASQTAPVFRVTERELLFEDRNYVGPEHAQYDVDPRSGRFLMIKSEQTADDAVLVVVVNWVEELRRRMGN